MMFKNLNLRRLDDKFTGGIRTRAGCTLILVKQDGSVSFQTGAIAKDEMLKDFTDGDFMMMSWTGQYRSDIFEITREDLDRYYK